MRLLFVLENYYPNIGGVETLFKTLVEKLVGAGHECVVITSRLNDTDPPLEAMPGLQIVRIPVSSRYLFTLRALRPIMRYIRKSDLVQTTSYNAGLPAFLVAFLFRKKVVITFHEAWGKLWFQLPFMGKLAKTAHYLFEQLLLRLPFDRFIAVSESTARRLREEGVQPQRIITIHNGIDYRDFRQLVKPQRGDQKFTFSYFGRLGISKGLDLLLEAAVKVQASLPDTRLQLIVPLVPEDILEWLHRTIRENGLEDYTEIRHHLPFPELKAAIAASDCVLIPSYSEGFCFAAVETMALGVPLISSGRGALSEVVGGKYIEMSSQTAEALAEAMEKAYRGAWREKAPRQFHLEETVEAYLKLYEGLT
jgi:glycosyltransferase involved in cell wall biosynthesis